MQKTKFKYNINYQISLLPRVMTIGQIEKILKNEHSISRDTFFRDRNLTTDDKTSIPSDRLDIYAALFSCTVDDLKNYIIKARPLAARKPSELMKKVIKESKLRKP